MREAFDYVIVDTAPVGFVIDCAVITPELDGTAIVINTTNSSYKQARRIMQQLEKSSGKILGVILNRAVAQGKGCRYGYGDHPNNK